MKSASPFLRITDLTVKYDGHLILDGLSLAVERGSITGILGFSASGKTTLLRAVVGLVPPDHGDIHVDNHSILSIPVNKRHIGFMHQDFALFDDYTVWENISFGLRYRSGVVDPVAHVRRLVQELHLEGTEKKYPNQLSGGQRQRVALARCLAPIPQLLLLDEPLSQLDPPLRSRAREVMLRLFLDHGSTVLLVSHDIEDCLDLCDRIAILDDKKIVETGIPADLIDNPQYLASALLTGHMNTIKINKIIKEEHPVCRGISDQGIVLTGECPSLSGTDKEYLYWGVRPAALSLYKANNNLYLGEGQILKKTRYEHVWIYQVVMKGTSISLRIETKNHNPAQGDTIQIHYDPGRAKFYNGKENHNV